MSNLYVNKVGRIELIADGESYVCTSLDYTMAINAVPIARVTVCAGRSLKHPDKRMRPEELLIRLARRETSLMQCTLKECVVGESDRTIFRGYLLDGGLAYSAAGTGTADIYFTCAGYAAALMASPGNAYVEASVGAVINDVVWRANADGIESVLSKNNEYMYTQTECMQSTYAATAYMPLVRRLAVLVTGARAAGSPAGMYQFTDAILNGNLDRVMDRDVLRAFGGKADLKYNALPFGCPEMFSNDLINHIVRLMSGGSMYDAISKCLTSPYFALELVPRWTCDVAGDFRTEIKPITAWRPRHTIALEADDVAKFRVSKNSIAAVSSPDVLLTIFPDPLLAGDQYASEEELYSQDGARGVAAKTPAMNRMLQTWTTNGILPYNMSTVGKVQQMNMPRWCAFVPSPTSATNVGELSRQQRLANNLAMIMLQYYYKAYDSAYVTLPPAFRFGRKKHHFENLLGERVTVNLDDNADKNSRDIRVYGCLSGITYKYTSTQSGTASAEYTLTLTRVGFGSPANGTISIDSPVYTY